jgi:hypothetical protein
MLETGDLAISERGEDFCFYQFLLLIQLAGCNLLPALAKGEFMKVNVANSVLELLDGDITEMDTDAIETESTLVDQPKGKEFESDD